MSQKRSAATVHLTNHASIATEWLAACLANFTTKHIVIVPDRGLYSYLSYELARIFPYPLLHVEIITVEQAIAEQNIIEMASKSGRSLLDTTAKIYGAFLIQNEGVDFRKEILDALTRERGLTTKDLHDCLEQIAFELVCDPKNIPEPARERLRALFPRSEERGATPHNACVHFFGFSSLQSELLEHLLEQKNAFLYLLSPCMMFWEDLFSDKELRRKKLPQADEATLQALYWERHPLLANSGKPSQKTVQIIHDLTPQFDESYLMPSSIAQHPVYQHIFREDVCRIVEDKKLTFLQMVQADLLTLSYKRRQKIEIEEDESIQIVSFRSRLREVYALRSFLLREASQISQVGSSESTLTPSSIVVYVPRLAEYLPFIKRVFGKDRKELPYEIVGTVPLDEKEFSTLFFHTIEWAFKRIRTQDVVRLLQSPHVQQKLDLEAEEFSSIAAFFEKSAFFEGKDPEAFSCALLAAGRSAGKEDSFNTWQDVKKAMVLSFMKKEVTGLIQIDTKGAEAIARCIQYIDVLFDRIDLYKKEPRHLSVWACLFEEHLALFFSHSPYDEAQKRRDERSLIEDAIMRLATLEDASVDLMAAFRLLQRMYFIARKEAKKVIQAPLVFASPGSMRGCPAQVVAYIGMHEIGIAESGTAASLSQNDIASIQLDEQAVTAFMGGLELPFIESLHHAQRSFYVSYQSKSRKTGVALSPVAPVQQLIDAIDNGFICRKSCFHSESRCTAPITTLPLDEPKRNLLSGAMEASQNVFKGSIIDISLLREVARNPLRAFLQRGHGMTLRYNQGGQGGIDEFWLDSRFEWQVKQALLHEKKPLTKEMKEYAPLAAGDLKKAAIATLEEESLRAKRAFHQLGIEEKIYMIELLPNCEAPEWTSQKKLCVPAIHMQTDNGAVMLTGEVGPVAEDGLVVLEKLSLRSYYAFYPDLLVLSLLGKQTGLYSVKDVKKKNYVLEDAEQRLASFIAYAQAAINFPSLLMPDWIKTIFEEEDPKKVVKKVFNDNAFLDPYVRYFADKYDDAALNKVLDKARKNVIHLFGRELQGNEEDSL